MATAHPTKIRPIRRAACALLVCVSLAACTPGDESSASPAPSGAPATVSAAPSASATATEPTGIPADALLQPSDVGGAEPKPIPEGDFSHVRPLRPCGDDRYPSDETRKDAVAVTYTREPTGSGEAPSVIAHFVGLHAPGGAAAQFDEVGDALKRCPGGLGEGQHRWTVIDRDVAGDESMVVRIDQRGSYADEAPETFGHYAALARVGDAIVVVTDLGWENTGGSEKLVRDLIGKAADRARAIG
jgi:hypothetical protein